MNKQISLRKGMLYNSVGSLTNLGCQWLTTVLVLRLGGYQAAGYLSLAMSITNIFYTIALFGMLSYQISDLKPEFVEKEYFTVKGFAILGATIFCLISSVWNGYELAQLLSILLYMLYRDLEAVQDTFYGIGQKAERLDLVGISKFLKGVFSLLLFVVLLLVFQSVQWAIAGLLVAVWITLLCYDRKFLGQWIAPEQPFQWEKAKLLFFRCFPAALSSVLYTVTLSMPKIYLEKTLGTELLGAYSSVGAPVLIVQVAASYLFIPLATPFAQYYERKDREKMKGLVMRFLGIVSVLVVVALLGVKFFGAWGLRILYGESILAYQSYLMPLTFCTILTALMLFLNMLMVVIRSFRGLLLSNILGLSTIFLSLPPLIDHFGDNGASYALILALVLQITVMAAVTVAKINRLGKE